MSYDYICAQVRWLHSAAYCDAIGVPKVSWKSKFVTISKVNFFLLMSMLGHAIPGLDERRIARIRPIIYNLVVESKAVGLGGAVPFELEWLPSLSSFVTIAPPLDPKDKRSANVGLEKHYITALLVVASCVSAGCALSSYLIYTVCMRFLT
ncbi:hypothetical protein MRB53_042155 [Persea americana]|nr:hypothetical protein MRB53_042155 [Persea americana]